MCFCCSAQLWEGYTKAIQRLLMPGLNTGKSNYGTVHIKTIILFPNVLQLLQVMFSYLLHANESTAKQRL